MRRRFKVEFEFTVSTEDEAYIYEIFRGITDTLHRVMARANSERLCYDILPTYTDLGVVDGLRTNPSRRDRRYRGLGIRQVQPAGSIAAAPTLVATETPRAVEEARTPFTPAMNYGLLRARALSNLDPSEEVDIEDVLQEIAQKEEDLKPERKIKFKKKVPKPDD